MNPQPITENTLFYGDNLDILRDYIPSESVDLIYLDPPFNSNRNYNVLFKDESGQDSEAQIEAFEDTWHRPLVLKYIQKYNETPKADSKTDSKIRKQQRTPANASEQIDQQTGPASGLRAHHTTEKSRHP